jgi:hypothetical protein
VDARVLKWVIGVLSVLLLVLGIMATAKYLWGSDRDKAYKDGYVYRDGRYVQVQRGHVYRRGDRDDRDDDDDDRRRVNNGQSNYISRFFRSFRNDDD